MNDYRFFFKPSIEKDLRGLSDLSFSIIMNKIESLKLNPFPPDSIKLAGTRRTYRIRVRDYRIIYEVDSRKKYITILYIRHRRDVYRNV